MGAWQNLGNFDQDGLNVNNNWDDNRDSNIGVSASRNFYPESVCN